MRQGAVKRRSYWLKEKNEVAVTEGPVGGTQTTAHREIHSCPRRCRNIIQQHGFILTVTFPYASFGGPGVYMYLLLQLTSRTYKPETRNLNDADNKLDTNSRKHQSHFRTLCPNKMLFSRLDNPYKSMCHSS